MSVTAIGGAEKRFAETLKFFCKNTEFEVFVLESPPSLLMKLEGRCIKQLVLPVFRGSGWLSNYVFWFLWAFKAAIKSLSIAKKVKPNAIFVPNNTFPNILSGFVASFFTRLPLSVVVHHFGAPFSVSDVNGGCSLYGCYRNVGYGRLVALFKAFSFYVSVALLKRAKVIVAVSNFTANVLENCGIVDARIFVSGNAADVGSIDSVKPLSAVKVYDGVFVGRIAKEKGVFDLVEAWKKVVKVKANAKLLIIGSGIELEALKKEVSLSNLENNVLVIGRCEEVELIVF